MNKTITKACLMLAILAGMLFSLNSCSKDSDARDLLSTVPENAQFAALINLNKLVKDLDLKTEGDRLELNKQLKELAADKDMPLNLLREGGVRLSFAAIFGVNDVYFITGFIGDQDAFRSYVEKQENDEFTKEGSLEVCGSVITADDRFWICSSRSDGPDLVRRFLKLDEKKSMAGTDANRLLVDDKCDVTAIISTDLLTRSNPQAAIGLQMLGGIDYMSGCLNFEQGRIDLDVYYLDSEYQKVAAKTVPFEKINMSTVKMLQGDMQMVAAVGIKKGLMGKITGQLPMQIPGIEGLEGTFALCGDFSVTQGSGLPPMMIAAKTASADDATQLGEFIKEQVGSGVKVSLKGQTLLVRTANLSGDLNVGPHLADLEGAYFGLVASPEVLRQAMPGNNIPFDGASLTIRPDGDSFKMEIRVYSSSKSNSLATLLKIAQAASKY